MLTRLLTYSAVLATPLLGCAPEPSPGADTAPGDIACAPATETCDGNDNDCDGVADEDDAVDATTWHLDADGDGFGAAGSADRPSCSAPTGYVADATDCDDQDADVSPGASERCNGLDDDCDNAVDEAGATDETAWYADEDSDDFGGALVADSCDAPAGAIAEGGDCDDGNRFVNPGATEACNGIDDDCASSPPGAASGHSSRTSRLRIPA